MRSIIILILTISSFAYGQEKISNNDLRKSREIFSISDLTTKKQKVYTLMTTSAGVFTMMVTLNGELVERWKLNTEDAERLDERFAGDFIDLKYIMAPGTQKKCSKTYHLNLRGEAQEICPNENDKVGKIKKLIAYLNTKLK